MSGILYQFWSFPGAGSQVKEYYGGCGIVDNEDSKSEREREN